MGVFGLDVSESAVCILPDGTSKRESLDALIDALSQDESVITDREAFRRAVYEREDVMSTGIGQGIAIPHVRVECVRRPLVGVAISHSGVDFGTLDDEPVYIIIMFAMPAGSQKEYLGLLAKVMLSLKTPGFRNKLLSCDTPARVAAVLNAEASPE